MRDFGSMFTQCTSLLSRMTKSMTCEPVRSSWLSGLPPPFQLTFQILASGLQQADYLLPPSAPNLFSLSFE
jgi:hypothetical protein